MNILAWFNPTRWLMLAAAVAALTLGYFAWADHQQDIGDARATQRWTAAIEKQKGEAARVLAVEVAKVRTAEQALQDFKNTQEVQDAGHQKTVASLSTRLRDIAGPAGRLRDPHQAGCGSGGGGAPGAAATAAGDRSDDAGQAGGLLSVEFSELFFARLREADDINTAYASCRADAGAVRGSRLAE